MSTNNPTSQSTVYSTALNTISGTGDAGGVPPPANNNTNTVTAVFFGQSELEYLLNPSEFFNQFPAPTIQHANATIITQSGDQVAPVQTRVTQATVDAGEVSYTMAALAEILGAQYPDIHFVIGDCAVSGTSRGQLADDTEDGDLGFDGFARYWTDFVSVIDLIETQYGPLQHFIECWYNSDANRLDTFREAFWPLYFGTDANGNSITLGTTHNDGGVTYVVDHCLWDALAATNEKGRGIFTREQTKWHILPPMPFNDGPETSPEAERFSQGLRVSEPIRELIRSLESDPLAQSVGLQVRFSAHITDFGGGIHPRENDRDGSVLLMHPFAAALIGTQDSTLAEPQINNITVEPRGLFAEIEVLLPNGGNLTTLRGLRTEALPPVPSPHQQAVTGFEIFRSSESSRRPAFRNDATAYPEVYRASVVITDAGSGNPRRGLVRIVPEIPFVFGDSISYLRGQASALLREDRDVPNKLFLDMLIEHVPELFDSTATYAFEGLAVPPVQSEIAIPVPAPAFTPRAAFFDGVNDGFTSTNSVNTNGDGLISLWFRNQDETLTSLKRLFQFRVSGSVFIEMNTSSNGRMDFNLEDSSGTNLGEVFYADGVSQQFAANMWFHFLIAWSRNGNLVIYVNDNEVVNKSVSDIFSGTFNRVGFMSESVLRQIPEADVGHVYVNLNETLDITHQIERDKFIQNGVPVNLGGNGQTPTGTIPEFYFDGDGNAFNNLGSFGPLTLSGELEASTGSPSLN